MELEKALLLLLIVTEKNKTNLEFQCEGNRHEGTVVIKLSVFLAPF